MALRCAVFASGGGSNFQTLLDRRDSGDLHVEFVILIGNNSSAGAFERAHNHGVTTLHLAPSHFSDEKEYTKKLLSVLTDNKIDLIILAGYMKMLPPQVVQLYRNRIVNIHPGLLPSFGGKGMYGIRVHQAVIDYGAKITGVTVHFVDEEYDHGAIICQECVLVEDGDDAEKLYERVLKMEHATFYKAIEAIAQGKIRVEGRRVIGNV